MNKVIKGEQGYLNYKKKIEIIRTLLYFVIVAAVFFLGVWQTGTRKNLLTVVAVVGCLPACKALVGLITRFPYKSVSKELANDIKKRSEHMTCIFDMVLTSTEKFMPVQCIVVSGNTIFGYAPDTKTDLKYTADFIKEILAMNRIKGINIKLYRELKAFTARVDGLDSIAAVEKQDLKEIEEKIAGLILNVSI